RRDGGAAAQGAAEPATGDAVGRSGGRSPRLSAASGLAPPLGFALKNIPEGREPLPQSGRPECPRRVGCGPSQLCPLTRENARMALRAFEVPPKETRLHSAEHASIPAFCGTIVEEDVKNHRVAGAAAQQGA